MKKLKVLIIDDELDFLEVMSKRIKVWGYEAIMASSGGEGIKTLKAKKPEVIVLDYMMPGMNGIATLKEIRKVNRKIPVIMFTAHPDEKSIKGADGLGITAFIPKISTYSDAGEALKIAIEIGSRQLRNIKGS